VIWGTIIPAEYEGVLRRGRFRLSPRQVSRSIRLLREAARIVTPHRELTITLDPADNRFLECAAAAKAGHLVTDNKRHFPKQWRQTPVVNARQSLEWIIPDLQR
jgi:predicted nucleic acid-binding protein